MVMISATLVWSPPAVQEAFSSQIWAVRIVEEPPVVVLKMQAGCRLVGVGQSVCPQGFVGSLLISIVTRTLFNVKVRSSRCRSP